MVRPGTTPQAASGVEVEDTPAVLMRLRAAADEFRERAQVFDRQIAERHRWIDSALRQEADLRAAIRALEGRSPENAKDAAADNTAATREWLKRRNEATRASAPDTTEREPSPREDQ